MPTKNGFQTYEESSAALHTLGKLERERMSDIPGAMRGSTVEAPKAEAKKFDTGKADLSLNPLIALEQMARAFMLGEVKYGRYNYTAGMDASRLVGAALRHVHQWNDGEDLDPESKASHLGHALACIAMLLHQQQLGTLKDNRRGKK